MQTAYITHPLCLKHGMGAHHPESPARIHAIEDQLIASGLLGYLQHHEAPEVTREQLLRVHEATYIDMIQASAPHEGSIAIDGDTEMNEFTYPAALRSAGAAVMAVDMVMTGQVENAFCNVRPPGHHAEKGQAMGFCFFNNICIGAAHAMAVHGLSRVAIADFDVHHGNGTEHIFSDEPRVMLCSTFQHPFYPYGGADTSNEHIVNVPLPAGAGSDKFREAVTNRWLPALEAFKPELLLISAGFDAHWEDDMSALMLVDGDYTWVSEQLKLVAAKHCRNRIVSLLEGGYELHALGRCVMAHIKVLSGL
jgi:acetoin utilization deacetylase AcuC-like enzyme